MGTLEIKFVNQPTHLQVFALGNSETKIFYYFCRYKFLTNYIWQKKIK